MSYSLILDSLTTVGVLIGAYVAIMGLNEWKKQLKGNTEYDLARRVLIKTFRVRDAFHQVRNPMMHFNKEDDEDFIKAEQRAFQKRLDKLHSEWSELYLEIVETEAIYGVDKKEIFQSLNKCRAELDTDIWEYFWLKGAYAEAGATVDDNPKRVKENRRKVFRTSKNPGKDPVSKKLDEAVSEVEKFFRPKLKL